MTPEPSQEMRYHGDLAEIRFADGDSNAVVLSGSKLPFKFGRATQVKYYGGALHVTIKPDPVAERTADAGLGLWDRVKLALGFGRIGIE